MLQEKEKEKTKRRYTAYAVFVGIISILFVVRLFMMQIVSGDKYLKLAEQKQMRNVTVKAPRGDILDRYGRPLVTNKVGYSLQIQKTTLKNDDFNNMLLRLYRLLEQEDAGVLETFPVSLHSPFEFTFVQQYPDSEAAHEAEIKWKTHSSRKFSESITAEEALEKYRARYKISSEYSLEDLRCIVGMKYEMEMREFSVTMPYTVASDVSMVLVTKIKEERADFPCVNVISDYVRQFKQGSTAAHILGRVGVISDTEYKLLKDSGYKLNDFVGKQGIEREYEALLRGIDGSNGLIETSEGFEVNPTEAKDPVPGNYVVLTIDSTLQTTLENALGQTIEDIRKRGGDPGAKSGGDAYCGAAVVLDIRTGEVLSMATWPTYSPEEFIEKYSELNSDPYKPMWNRAISGTYPPGSTFKMLTSIAALESGVITPSTVIKDEGVYTAYQDYQPACWLWRRSHLTHGNQTVSDALTNSCNYFYYEVGKQMGIETMNAYTKKFGLGEYTGIELKREEAKGRIAGPSDREQYSGKQWTGGDTLQSAIGQSDNLFTPLQLANYVSTLVNGGERFEPHIVKNVRSSVDGANIQEIMPKVLENISMKPENIGAVLGGMLGVTEDGTASTAFKGYAIKVGGKTGSAQVGVGSDNGVFVGFAPYDKPEIAVAVVIEHGNSGSDVAPVVKAVFDQYFLSSNHQSDINNSVGVLLL